MSLAEILQYLTLALSIIALLGHGKNFFSSGEKSLVARIDKAETSIADHEKRIGGIEGEMEHLPTQESQHRIEMNMAELSKEIAVLTESLKPIRANGELLADLLREQVRKS
ncbi:hypothetical protein J2046_003041 [Rhizobium petrolearium]|uniref:DUF2730 family protein n=1 Tax=Neorhizobium petrolearium TaxID=515361 RepID=UPI001AE8B7D8|nr:DUF2730 family protein [Neorhizobium petrolearium]MBP1844774.1 hypothetical protein [Neorhizobium petrolearium]